MLMKVVIYEKSIPLKNFQLIICILIFLTLFVYYHSQLNLRIVYAATINCTVSSSQLITTQPEQQLLNDVNNYRVQKGLSKLTMDPTLKQAAAWLTNDMATHNTLSHTDSLGRTIPTRLTDCGYDITFNDAESISNESSNPDTVFAVWKADPTHNAIMLLIWPNITGISMQSSSKGVTYWTMDIGANSNAVIQQPAPSAITPQLHCLGTGPCLPTSPPTIPITQPLKQVTTTISKTPSQQVSIAPSQPPCSTSAQSTGTVQTQSTHYKSKNGLLSQFILLLFQLIIEIINLLFGSNITPISQTQTPCISPSI